MSTLSTAAWAAHEVGLATTIGGTIFGQMGLDPAIQEISSPAERDRVQTSAWRRFSYVNLAAHGVMAATWFAGRTMLSGNEVSKDARTLTKVKDGLVIASLVTGLTCNVFGRLLGRRTDAGLGPNELADRAGGEDEADKTHKLQRFVSATGTLNLIANIAVLGVTTMLAMQASESGRFPLWSRRLP